MLPGTLFRLVEKRLMEMISSDARLFLHQMRTTPPVVKWIFFLQNFMGHKLSSP
jgi:hypothetical protein